MTQCVQLSDRMPEVASGRSHWSAEEHRHLQECRTCAAEWALVTVSGRVGGGWRPSVSPEETAASVLARLRAERSRRPLGTALAWGSLAAAALIALAVGILHWRDGAGSSSLPWRSVATEPAPRTPAGVGTHGRVPPRPFAPSSPRSGAPAGAQAVEAAGELPLPELDSLPPEALDSILRALDEPLARVAGDDLAPDEAGDRELARALAGQEG